MTLNVDVELIELSEGSSLELVIVDLLHQSSMRCGGSTMSTEAIDDALDMWMIERFSRQQDYH